MRYALTCCLFLMMITLSDHPTNLFAENTGAALTAVIEGAEFCDRMITTGMGHVSILNVFVDSLSQRTKNIREMRSRLSSEGSSISTQNYTRVEVFVAFDWKKLRVDHKGFYLLPSGKLYYHLWKHVFDGEKAILLRLDSQGMNDLIEPKADIYEDDSMFKQYSPVFYGTTIYGTPVSLCLKGEPIDCNSGKKAFKDFNFVGKKIQDGIPCSIVRGYSRDTGDTLMVWIAPDIMYRPVKIEVASSTEVETVNNLFQKHTNGLWFPQQIRIESYYYDVITHKKILEKFITFSVHDDFTLQNDIPDSIFDASIPDGANVFDHRTNESYVEGINKRKEDSQPVKR